MRQRVLETLLWRRGKPDRKFDVVIAAGGDGTLNEVVNGLVGHEFRPKFGIIPVGTTNDFARAIGVPRSIEEAKRYYLRRKNSAIRPR